MRRLLTALLAPPFNPKSMSIDISGCGFGFIFASQIQRLLRVATLDISDNVFMLPPAKIVAGGMLAVQKCAFAFPSLNFFSFRPGICTIPQPQPRARSSLVSRSRSQTLPTAQPLQLSTSCSGRLPRGPACRPDAPSCGARYSSQGARPRCRRPPTSILACLQQNSARPLSDRYRKRSFGTEVVCPAAQPVPLPLKQIISKTRHQKLIHPAAAAMRTEKKP